nr:hypothetical protein [Micromonospora sp. CB01531]
MHGIDVEQGKRTTTAGFVLVERRRVVEPKPRFREPRRAPVRHGSRTLGVGGRRGKMKGLPLSSQAAGWRTADRAAGRAAAIADRPKAAGEGVRQFRSGVRMSERDRLTSTRFLAYGGVELNASTGLVRLYPEMHAVLLSSQQAEVLAVLIDRAGNPCCREEIAAAMPKSSRPPTMAQIGVVIANIRNKLGAHRVLTGAGGWWLGASDAPCPPAWPDAISFGGLHLDLPRRRVWVSGRRSTIRLGWQEYLVLRELIEAQGMPRGRNEIWHAMPAGARRARPSQVGEIVYRLRQRLGQELIITGGGGWRLAGRIEDEAFSAGASDAILLDPTTRRVALPGRGTRVCLSAQEAATLRVLIEARGVPLSSTEVFASTPAAVRPKSALAISRIVFRLRQKLGPDHIRSSRQGWWLGTAPARLLDTSCC